MSWKGEIQRNLEGLTADFIGRSPFFRFWDSEPVSEETSKRFLLSFDALVKSFPSLIAAGAARMEDEQTRVVLAVNLYQESGEGVLSRTHHAIYRKFLDTAGVGTPPGESDFAAEWKANLATYIQTQNPRAVLGALAAGEFLAQPALTRIYGVLKAHYPQADQEYFTHHLVLEGEHVEEITAIIARNAPDEASFKEVVLGFTNGLSVWGRYFERLTDYLSKQVC
jgi:pyrroloquinoline quinone (PQQ) biosynthesis protein C